MLSFDPGSNWSFSDGAGTGTPAGSDRVHQQVFKSRMYLDGFYSILFALIARIFDV